MACGLIVLYSDFGRIIFALKIIIYLFSDIFSNFFDNGIFSIRGNIW